MRLMRAFISEELLMQIAASVIFAINRKKEKRWKEKKEETALSDTVSSAAKNTWKTNSSS